MNEIRPNQPPTSTPPPFDGEIDLVDLALALWKRRWLVIGFTLAGLLLGVVAGVLKTEGHELSAVVVIGKDPDSDSGALIQSTETVAELLQSSLIPSHDDLLEAQGLDPRAHPVDLHKGNSDIVRLSAPVTEENQTVIAQVIERAVDDLAQAIDKPIHSQQASIEAEIRKLELELDESEDEDRVEHRRTELKQEIVAKENELASLQDNRDLLEQQVERLQQMIQQQQERAEEISGYLTSLRSSGAVAGASSASEAMTAMLLGNQVQSYVDQLSSINRQITVELPGKISDVQAKIAQADREKQELKTAIEQAQLEFKLFEKNLEREVESVQLKLDDARSGLKNLEYTRLLDEPQVVSTQGTSGALLAALGLILGGFLGLFAALMANFIAAARERLEGETESEE